MNYNLYEIGLRAYNARLNKNMMQEELSEALGISQASYSKFENGKYDIPLTKLIKLCAYLGVSVSWLIGEPTDRLTEQELIELERYKNYLISQRKNKP